jgi:hypothetical protein
MESPVPSIRLTALMLLAKRKKADSSAWEKKTTRLQVRIGIAIGIKESRSFYQWA